MAMLKSSFTLIILTFALFPCVSLSSGVYQYFQLVQQWPPNYCFDRKFTCIQNLPQYFTIHGLWPSNFSQVKYQHNCLGDIFDNQMLQNRTMANQLHTSWPELKSRDDKTFWTEQWEKHGRCSDQTYGQTQYFQRSYEIWDQYKITDIFRNAGLVSNTPTTPKPCNVRAIERRIQAATHVAPGIRCRRVNVQQFRKGKSVPLNVQLIFEVVLCYDYAGRNLINCTGAQSSKCIGNNIYF